MTATDAHERNRGTIKALPCPFCGKQPWILVTDDEGNVYRNEGAYLADPFSGLQFCISHPADCPIGTPEDEYYVFGYDSRDEAIEAWNTRAN